MWKNAPPMRGFLWGSDPIWSVKKSYGDKIHKKSKEMVFFLDADTPFDPSLCYQPFG